MAAAAVISFSLASCSHNISGVNSSDPYVAEQAQKAQLLQDQANTQERLVETEKERLKVLKLQLDGAKQNLKGRKAANKV
ncbi:hypothetical protein [Hymenobacter nivis]|uniref:hypothetical protein n=1 Tax=Hymenobacter nivis TaxID=1850093 RepID=UPI001B87BD5A|nr:hypothetical protein [Hymenobacter nivis]